MKRLLAGIAALLMTASGMKPVFAAEGTSDSERHSGFVTESKVLNRAGKRMRAVGSMISFGTSDKVQAEAK